MKIANLLVKWSLLLRKMELIRLMLMRFMILHERVSQPKGAVRYLVQSQVMMTHHVEV